MSKLSKKYKILQFSVCLFGLLLWHFFHWNSSINLGLITWFKLPTSLGEKGEVFFLLFNGFTQQHLAVSKHFIFAIIRNKTIQLIGLLLSTFFMWCHPVFLQLLINLMFCILRTFRTLYFLNFTQQYSYVW